MRVPHAVTRRTAARSVLAVATAVAATTTAMLAAGPVSAATPPTVSVALAGTDGWKLSWDGSPATSCDILMSGTWIAKDKFSLSHEYLTGPPFTTKGDWKFSVRCAGETSNVVHLYSPRSPENDLRTQFSSITAGAFGS
ncbi:hypothetical protein [Gordonia sp. FQ]|uniref:hypothetical protein n=1 Tax=Gordonia sp. FQ TaxID=3446634 RepID=UPI003F84371C